MLAGFRLTSRILNLTDEFLRRHFSERIVGVIRNVRHPRNYILLMRWLAMVMRTHAISIA